MIAAYDIGNTNVKVFLYDDNRTLIAKKTRPTPDLFEPQMWHLFHEELKALNPAFAAAQKRISCVSWKAFLALRVYLGYAPEETFDENLPFDPSLLGGLPADSPFVFESMIPLSVSNQDGLVGTDRLLAAYALYTLYKDSYFVAGLGTATTIDLITASGIFLGGAIIPGVDSAYSGLISRAPHLPPIFDLPPAQKILGTNVAEALAAGTFVGHAVMLEGLFSRMRRDAALEESVNLALTGGRAYSISPYIRIPHTVKEDLVALGLALMPAWYGDEAPEPEPEELKHISEFLAYEPLSPAENNETPEEELAPPANENNTLFRIHVEEGNLSDAEENPE